MIPPADRDSVPEMSNLLLAPLLILIKLISSLSQGSNWGIHYYKEKELCVYVCVCLGQGGLSGNGGDSGVNMVMKTINYHSQQSH